MKKILLIEDNTDIRENIAELLELEGYKVTAVANGREGLQLAKEQLPDIVLSDVIMPELTGHDVYRELKKDELTRFIPFVFITSSVEKKEVEAAINNGADGYIQKPFEEKELFDAIKRCIKINCDSSSAF